MIGTRYTQNPARTARSSRWVRNAADFFLYTGCLLVLMGCSGGFFHSDDAPLGREVIRNPAEWWCKSNDTVVVYAQNPEILASGFKKAVYLQRKAAMLLRTDTQPLAPIYVYLLQDPVAWDELSAKYAIHTNTVSLTVGSEVVTLARDREDLFSDAVPHELIHVVIISPG